MKKVENFNLQPILAVTTRDRTISWELVDLLDFMLHRDDDRALNTTRNLNEDEFADAMRICRIYLLGQHPFLRHLDTPPELIGHVREEWIKQNILRFGKKLPVERFPQLPQS